MATLTNTKIKDTYDGLLKTTDNDVIGASEKVITDGLGNASVLSIGTASASFSSDIEVNTLTIGLGSGSIATNTALGLDALFSNTSGSGNVSVGQGSMRSNTSGSTNIAVGKDALRLNTTGGINVAIGYTSLYSNTIGQNNTAVGNSSSYSNTTGLYNTALGSSALYANETSGNNTALGYFALRNNTAASNTAVGSGALADNTTGGVNTAVGKDALNSNTTGGGNTAIGYQALQTQTAQSSNTAVGHLALKNNVASNNTAVGSQALTANTTGQNNTAIGSSALQSNVDGIWNTALGYGAGYNKTGGNSNIYIGYQAIGGAVNSTNEIVIGKGATGNGSNTATYGNESIDEHHFGGSNIKFVANGLIGDIFLGTGLTSINNHTANGNLGLWADDGNQVLIGKRVGSSSYATNLVIDTSTGLTEVTNGNFAVDTNTLYVDAANNRVGVGTSSPDLNLDVNGYARASSGFVGGTGLSLWSDASAVSAGLILDTSNNVGIGTSGVATKVAIKQSEADWFKGIRLFASSNNHWTGLANTGSLAVISSSYDSTGSYTPLAFYTSDTERMRIDSSGNVGIGVVPSANVGNLQIGGSAQSSLFAQQGTDTVRAGVRATGRTGIVFDSTDSTYTNRMWYIDNVGSSGKLIIGRNGLDVATFDNSGNVGIGGAPTHKLYVRNDVGASTDLDPTSIKLYNNSDGGAAIEFSNGVAGNSKLSFGVEGTGGFTDESYIGFSTSANGATATERMRIDSSGNVGIGTSSPDYPLHIVGTNGIIASMSNDSVNSNKGARYMAGAYTGNLATFALIDGTSGNNVITIGGGTGAGEPSTEIRFNTGSAGTLGSGTERMRITSGGDLNIGKTQTDWTVDGLQTEYDGESIGITTSVGAYNNIFLRKNNATGNVAGFYYNSTIVGSISISSSSTSYNTSSDYRLKENVVEMTGALDRVDALKPSRFNFIADPEKTVDGFLAHEVQAIVPEAVTGEKDAVDEEGNPIYQGIDQSKIVPLLVGAIKELRAEIELLKSQLNA